jgi:predicted PurR-regulated permease PerM
MDPTVTARVWMTRGAAATLGALVVVGLVWLAASAMTVLLLLFLSILLAAGLEPLIERLRGRLPMGRLATILLVYALFLVAVVVLALVIVPGALAQAGAVVERLPDVLAEVRAWAEGLRPAALSETVVALVDELAAIVAAPAPPSGDDVVEASLTVAEALVAVATILTIVIFWLVEHPRLQRYALAFLPSDRRAGAREAWNDVEERLGLWVRGQLILMGSIGLATGIAYSLLGVPAALLLAVIAAICEAIPIIGPLLGAIPALLFAATVSPELALVVCLVYIVIQIVEGNVLVPLVMRNTIGLSPFLVIVSLLVGTAVAGIAGALVAVPIAASIEVVLERLQAREVPVAPDPTAVRDEGVDEDEAVDPGLKRAVGERA